MQRAESLEKTWMLGKIEDMRRSERQMMMVRWHQLNGHEFEQTLGDSEGQGSLGAVVHGSQSQTRLVNEQQKCIECSIRTPTE